VVSTKWDHSPHFSSFTLDFERNVAGDLISLRGDIGWPARPPDLTIADDVNAYLCRPVLKWRLQGHISAGIHAGVPIK
jgi:hypothetical protein